MSWRKFTGKVAGEIPPVCVSDNLIVSEFETGRVTHEIIVHKGRVAVKFPPGCLLMPSINCIMWVRDELVGAWYAHELDAEPIACAVPDSTQVEIETKQTVHIVFVDPANLTIGDGT